MIDHSAAHRTGAAFEMRIESGKVREFAAATGGADADYRAADAVISPTFLTTQIIWEQWGGPDANPWHYAHVDERRTLHAEQEYIFYGEPPRAGTVLTARSRVGEIVTKPGRRGGELTFVPLITEFRDESGRLVAEAVMTAVEVSSAPGS